jgi:hypothetical protein
VVPVSPGVEGSRRMKRDLIWGWISTILVIVGIFLVVFCICIDNLAAIPMCVIALLLNAGNAAIHFHDYKRRKTEWKDCMTRFNNAFNACWPEDKPDDENRITD